MKFVKPKKHAKNMTQHFGYLLSKDKDLMISQIIAAMLKMAQIKTGH